MTVSECFFYCFKIYILLVLAFGVIFFLWLRIFPHGSYVPRDSDPLDFLSGPCSKGEFVQCLIHVFFLPFSAVVPMILATLNVSDKVCEFSGVVIFITIFLISSKIGKE